MYVNSNNVYIEEEQSIVISRITYEGLAIWHISRITYEGLAIWHISRITYGGLAIW
jgi:hypothetical protein